MLSSHAFVAMGTLNRVVVGEPSALAEAAGIVEAEIRRIDDACSRFRGDSELSRLNARAGSGPVPVSPLLEAAVAAALRSAEITGGLVDPTVGPCLEAIGYSVTFRDLPADGPPLPGPPLRVAGWRAVGLDVHAHTLRLPESAALDLGASCKAWAADRCAAMVAERLGVGAAVDCGGDVAVAGPAPEAGWPVRVAPAPDADAGWDLLVFDGGLATSGTTARRWRRGGVEIHHIVDPATGLPAVTPWSMATVAAATCLEANAAATASVVLGEHAPRWLEHRGLPGRLVDREGRSVLTGAWRGLAA